MKKSKRRKFFKFKSKDVDEQSTAKVTEQHVNNAILFRLRFIKDTLAEKSSVRNLAENIEKSQHEGNEVHFQEKEKADV